MVAPSLEMVAWPLFATMSLSMPRGPRVEATRPATERQAAMLDRSWPVPWEVSVPSRSSTTVGLPIRPAMVGWKLFDFLPLPNGRPRSRRLWSVVLSPAPLTRTEPVKIDPAITKWDYGLNNSWRTFKFTTVTARQSLVWGVLVPFVVYQIVQTQDVSPPAPARPAPPGSHATAQVGPQGRAARPAHLALVQPGRGEQVGVEHPSSCNPAVTFSLAYSAQRKTAEGSLQKVNQSRYPRRTRWGRRISRAAGARGTYADMITLLLALREWVARTFSSPSESRSISSGLLFYSRVSVARVKWWTTHPLLLGLVIVFVRVGRVGILLPLLRSGSANASRSGRSRRAFFRFGFSGASSDSLPSPSFFPLPDFLLFPFPLFFLSSSSLSNLLAPYSRASSLRILLCSSSFSAVSRSFSLRAISISSNLAFSASRITLASLILVSSTSAKAVWAETSSCRFRSRETPYFIREPGRVGS